MSDKTLKKSSLGEKPKISNAALELTQKVQMHFPRGLNPSLLNAWNRVPVEYLNGELIKFFNRYPNPALKLINSITISAGSGEDFFVCNKFAEEEWIAGSDFREVFFDKKVKVLRERAFLKRYELSRDCYVRSILDEISLSQGNLIKDTTLREVFTLVELQNDGRPGNLLSDGQSNLFVIEGSMMIDVVFSEKWKFLYCMREIVPSTKKEGARIFVRYKNNN